MYRIVAHSYPNNEIRVTWSSLPHPKDPLPDHDILSPDPSPSMQPPLIPSPDEINSRPLSLVPNSQTQRNPVGFGSLPLKPTTFGMNGKRSLLRHGGALEKTAPAEECLFLTGTLPGSTEDSFRAIAAWSGYVIHRLKSWIGNYAPSKYDFYCWEYQKRGALHLHYCVWLPDSAARSMVLDKFREWWIEILHRIGESENTDMFRKNSGRTWLSDLSKVRAVAEVCRKSPARYLAKYLSKSATPKRGASRSFSPSRWWGTSRPLKALCDSMTQEFEVVVGGFQAVRHKWEEVWNACASSDSVTYSYRHKVGVGITSVSYPANEGENEWLLNLIKSFSTMSAMSSRLSSDRPSLELKSLKTAQLRWLSESLANSQGLSTGLVRALEVHSNWIHAIILSTSVDPLSTMLAWSAHNSHIQSMCQFTPLQNFKTKRLFKEWNDCLEHNIERVAESGYS